MKLWALLRSRWYVAASVAAGAGLLAVAFRGVAFGTIASTLRGGHIPYLVIACVVVSFSYFVRSLRWRTLLQTEGRPPRLKVFFATMLGYLGNTFLPGRAGDVVRSVALGRGAGMSSSFVLGTTIAERAVDVVGVVLVAAVTMPLASGLPHWLVRSLLVTIGVGIGAVALLAMLHRVEARAEKLLRWLPLPGSVGVKAAALIPKFLLGIRAFLDPTRTFRLISLTILVWFLDTVVTILVAEAFDLRLGPGEALLFLATLGVASGIILTPGYVGVMEFIAVTLLVPFGFSKEAALAYIIAFRGVGYVVVVTWGFLGLWQLATWNQGKARSGLA